MFEYGDRDRTAQTVVIRIECDWCKKRKRYVKYEKRWTQSLAEGQKDGWRDIEGAIPDYANVLSFCCGECLEKYKEASGQRHIDRIAKGCKQCSWMSHCYNDKCEFFIPMSDYTPAKKTSKTKGVSEKSAAFKVSDLKQCIENVENNYFYVRREKDDRTAKRVLTSYSTTGFDKDSCFFANKGDLSPGVYYVSCEKQKQGKITKSLKGDGSGENN